MTREACTLCNKVVSTTHDPNNYEGWFVSLVTLDELESGVDEMGSNFYAYVVELLNKLAPRLVVCDECQRRMRDARGG